MNFLQRKYEMAKSLDLNCFYVENVRALFNLPRPVAKFFCETAVRRGELNKRYGIKCPTCRVMIEHFPSEEQIPDHITCELCELNDRDPNEFNKGECQVIEFYQLPKE